MKRFTVIAALFSFALLLTAGVQAQEPAQTQTPAQTQDIAPSPSTVPEIDLSGTQIVPGTQVRLTLRNSITTKVAKDGDPFTAVVAEPVFSGNTLLLPAGAIIHGTVSGISKAKMFGIFRSGASMNIQFTSVEVESRLFPARMSIISIAAPGDDDKLRKDLKTTEGEVVSQNRDIKGSVLAMAIGTAGGSTVGFLFSNVARGTIYGLAGSGAYICIKKGKELDLPAQTKVVVRMDAALSLPAAVIHRSAYTNNGAE